MDYSSLDTKKFIYSLRIETEKKLLVGESRLVRRKAVDKVNKNIETLLASELPTVKNLGKQMKLEKEYINAKQLEDLKISIEKNTGHSGVGVYTLAEAGLVLGLTRERIRQLEDSALKILKHPDLKRILREYTYGMPEKIPQF